MEKQTILVVDSVLSRHFSPAGLHVSPLSSYYYGKKSENGFVPGYAGLSERAIRSGVGLMARGFKYCPEDSD